MATQLSRARVRDAARARMSLIGSPHRRNPPALRCRISYRSGAQGHERPRAAVSTRGHRRAVSAAGSRVRSVAVAPCLLTPTNCQGATEAGRREGLKGTSGGGLHKVPDLSGRGSGYPGKGDAAWVIHEPRPHPRGPGEEPKIPALQGRALLARSRSRAMSAVAPLTSLEHVSTATDEAVTRSGTGSARAIPLWHRIGTERRLEQKSEYVQEDARVDRLSKTQVVKIAF
jgi:hypothetical protein